MQSYLTKRLILFPPTLFIVSVVIFCMMRVLPGDIADTVLGGSGQSIYNKQQLESIRDELGLNDPYFTQYLRWLWSMVNGEFGGRSLETREELRSLLARQIPVTIQLSTYTVFLSFGMSVSLGVVSAMRQNQWPDYLIRLLTVTGNAIPNFWAALLVLLGLVLLLNWSPPVIYEDLWENPVTHVQMVVLPVLILTWGYSAHITRITRSALLDVLRQDYIRTALSKGLTSRQVIFRHAMRNALAPVFSVAGLQLSSLLGGTMVLESIFGLPGIGRGLVQAVSVRDYTVIQSLATAMVFLIMCVNLLVDIIYAFVDPRISYSG